MPVTRFEIALSRPLADGASWSGPAGDVGPYEELKGRLYFAIDPLHPANRRITDVTLGTRGAAGRVEWSSDVSILLPVDRAKCSGRIMLDVVNRGNTVAVPNFNRATRPVFGPGSDPNPPIDVGDGFLMKRGFAVISCGWQGDVPEVPGLFRMHPPEARDSTGQPLRGRVYTQLQSAGPTAHFLLSDRGHIPYPAADLEEAGAVLTVRDRSTRAGRRSCRARACAAWRTWRRRSRSSGRRAPRRARRGCPRRTAAARCPSPSPPRAGARPA